MKKERERGAGLCVGRRDGCSLSPIAQRERGMRGCIVGRCSQREKKRRERERTPRSSTVATAAAAAAALHSPPPSPFVVTSSCSFFRARSIAIHLAFRPPHAVAALFSHTYTFEESYTRIGIYIYRERETSCCCWPRPREAPERKRGLEFRARSAWH